VQHLTGTTDPDWLGYYSTDSHSFWMVAWVQYRQKKFWLAADSCTNSQQLLIGGLEYTVQTTHLFWLVSLSSNAQKFWLAGLSTVQTASRFWLAGWVQYRQPTDSYWLAGLSTVQTTSRFWLAGCSTVQYRQPADSDWLAWVQCRQPADSDWLSKPRAGYGHVWFGSS
jgi:hypothetical protein